MNNHQFSIEILNYIDYLCEKANEFIEEEVHSVYKDYNKLIEQIFRGEHQEMITDSELKSDIKMFTHLFLPKNIIVFKQPISEYEYMSKGIKKVDSRFVIGKQLETSKDLSNIKEIVFQEKMRIYKREMYKTKSHIIKNLKHHGLYNKINTEKLFRELRINNF